MPIPLRILAMGEESLGATRTPGNGILPGATLIADADGNPMTPTHAKRAKRYRYYVSASLLAGERPQAKQGMRTYYRSQHRRRWHGARLRGRSAMSVLERLKLSLFLIVVVHRFVRD